LKERWRVMFFSVFGDVLEWHRWVGFLFLFLFSSLHFTLAIADQNQGEKRENQGEGLTTDWRLLFHFPGGSSFPFRIRTRHSLRCLLHSRRMYL